MTVLGVIPARFASSRFPGKALAPLGGYPMVHHVYASAKQAKSLDHVVIATESTRVATDLALLGDKTILTSADHKSGTDRVAEVAKKHEADIIVNIQGDEPQLQPEIMDSLVEMMKANPDVRMATVASTVLNDDDRLNPNVVKVVVHDGRAQSFYRESFEVAPVGDVMRHIGIYAFRRDFLLEFSAHPQSSDEVAHSLEQLRAAEMGVTLGVVTTDFNGRGVDTRAQLIALSQDWQNAPWIEAK